MRTEYICEICGNRSQNQQEILNCEAQGSKIPFDDGDRVLHNGHTWTIQKHRFEKNHSIKYFIRLFVIGKWVSENEFKVVWYSQAL